jgi:photosystem II stability/assembly factor-like uncharacterized protein
MRIFLLPTLLSAASLPFFAQSAPPAAQAPVWTMEDSGTTAGLRGIYSVDGTVAWASGTGGTVLRTTDGGAHWTHCATPNGDKDGAKLDFRGVQAWDAKTAIVMASGPGELSRLYKTKDGCESWKLIFRNPDKDGFFDAIYLDDSAEIWLLGDPVNGMFTLFVSDDAGKIWFRDKNPALRVKAGTQGAFAASNSSLHTFRHRAVFGTGGTDGASVFSVTSDWICIDDCTPDYLDILRKKDTWSRDPVALGQKTDSSGVFSVAVRHGPISKSKPSTYISEESTVIVGGDYSKPNDTANTAAYRLDSHAPWTASTTPPHGYRSSVQWSKPLKAWITVGTNGSDVSRDDGKNWQPLDDGDWNALSLPFVVGPKGRIAKLNPAAVPAAK